MFGYRIVREAEYDALMKKREDLDDARAVLLREIGKLQASVASKSSMCDMLTARNTVIEHELALKKHMETGLPVKVAEIGRGTPLVNPGLGAGADLFEDVGDERAEALRVQGLLHDAGEDFAPPSAETLTASVGG